MLNKEEIISEIIKNESEITQAFLNGNKPSDKDIYHDKRVRNEYLRKLLKQIEN